MRCMEYGPRWRVYSVARVWGPRYVGFRGCYRPRGFRAWAGPSRQEILRRLEEYQRDLEQELLDVQARITELREEKRDGMTA
jgi:hypothetical protein